jgi:nucleoside-diphosphate-sugar epimerase
VFVTGASGLLGGSVTRQLLAEGREVVALIRNAERARRILPANPRLRLLTGDLTQVDGFAAALRNVDGVIHTAASLREFFEPGFDPELLYRTNVVAVSDLLAASVEAAVPVVVHVSSTSTVGRAVNGVLADEDTPSPPRQNEYHDSKLLAEQAIRRACAQRPQLRVPIIMPASLWGPGDGSPTATGSLFLGVARGELPALPRAGYYMVDARDVAAACVRALCDGVGLRRYIVAGVRWTLWEAGVEIARIVGARAPRALPARLTYPLAAAMELQAKLRRRPTVATRLGARILLERDRVRMSSQRAQQELCVSFRPFEQTLADQAAWYREAGIL